MSMNLPQNHPADSVFEEQYQAMGRREEAVAGDTFKLATVVTEAGGVALVASKVTSAVYEGVVAGVHEQGATTSEVAVPRPLETAETLSQDVFLGGLALGAASVLYMFSRHFKHERARINFRKGWEAKPS